MCNVGVLAPRTAAFLDKSELRSISCGQWQWLLGHHGQCEPLSLTVLNPLWDSDTSI